MRYLYEFVVISSALSLAVLNPGCKGMPIDASVFAAEAGESTIVLGSCGAEWQKGWESCLVEKGGDSFPTLRFLMMNPGSWAVSDCELGLYEHGASEGPQVVEVDLSGLRSQAEKNGFCILKLEAIETYPDPRDGSQSHPIPLRGGFFIEMVKKGYLPTPSQKQIAFCVKAYRTTAGRTIVQQCTR